MLLSLAHLITQAAICLHVLYVHDLAMDSLSDPDDPPLLLDTNQANGLPLSQPSQKVPITIITGSLLGGSTGS
jgi:hypothetical protein